MAVLWPPGNAVVNATGFILEGITTIVWGTDYFAQTLGGYAIVKSVRPSERVEEIRIENGVGLTAIDVLLKDGFDYEVTVVDQFIVSYPVVGSTLQLVIPFDTNSHVGVCVANAYDAARKKEGERIFTMRTFNLISGLQ